MKSSVCDWHYYNHSAIPSTAPHEVPNLECIADGSIWHIEEKRTFLARYTTNWDCGYETSWWYVIKDTAFDISALKTKRRYEITKALRFFDVKEINPVEHTDALAKVQETAFSAYPAKYRPTFNKDSFFKSIDVWRRQIHEGSLKFFAAFYKETNELAGYSYVNIYKSYLNFSVQKVNPVFEKYNVNAALVNGVLDAFKDKLSKDFYICDGSRAINHETHFQDYLEKYFGFRKAYCRLHLAYPPLCKFMITSLYPFRRFVALLGRRVGVLHHLSSILEMEKIARECK
jgi:hypothetical protein